ncbi:hypothetical protein BYT27DRAFT_7124718 [Phlegmacium glaucopus]|nr:hypothetical protein BYT27DRAFT_7124718 [Phlegmacium glaucopus]
MSQTLENTPASSGSGLGGYNCSNCGRFVAFKACQSNTNGNRGRLVATCHLTNAQGEQCKFIRFASGGSKSPSMSPPSMSTLTFPPTPLALLTGPVPSRCLIQGCGQTRIAEDCPRRICRKHCVEQGGCMLKKHKVANSTAPALPPAISFTLPAELRGLQGISYHNNDTPSEPLDGRPLDGRPHPRFASHLTPIYTESLTREYELQQTNARLDAERIASAKQAAQKVTVYAWKLGADEPEIRSIQQGFTWPYFKLSPTMLALVDLECAGELGALQMYDDVDLEAWLTVDVGHVVVVHEGQQVFLRDCSVKNCPGFDKHLKEIHHPHLRTGLRQERAFVREAHKAATSSKKRKAMSPPDSFSPPVKRERPSSTPPYDHPTPLSLSTPSSTPTPSLHTLSPPVALVSLSAPATGSSINEPIELGDFEDSNSTKAWPRDYYTSDVAACFRDSKTSVRGPHKRTAAVIFNDHFPHLTYHRSTFYENKAIWRDAPQNLKSRFHIIGKNKRGLWSVFTRAVKEAEKAQATVTTAPAIADVLELTDSD